MSLKLSPIKNKKQKLLINKKTARAYMILGLKNDHHQVHPNKKKSYKFNKFNKFSLNRKTLKHKKNIKGKFQNIILFPHELGQFKPGVDKTPNYIAKFIKNKKNKKNKKFSHIKNTGNFFKNVELLYNKNKSINNIKINIGGDHSMCIATIADTLNRYPDAKIIYFDAHGDIATYAAIAEKKYHGMPLSFLIGLDKDKRFPFIKNKLPFDNLLYIGIRSLEPFEQDIIYKYNIKYIKCDEFNKHSDSVINKIDDFIKDTPVHISFDVDVIDPKYIPSTGTTSKNGLKLDIAKKILDYLYTKNIVNVDITELNVELGSHEDIDKSVKNTLELFDRFLS